MSEYGDFSSEDYFVDDNAGDYSVATAEPDNSYSPVPGGSDYADVPTADLNPNYDNGSSSGGDYPLDNGAGDTVNSDGSYTDSFTGKDYDAAGNDLSGAPNIADVPGIVDNEDGTFTNPDTGLIFDNHGQVTGDEAAPNVADIPGIVDNRDGTFTNPDTGLIFDEGGAVVGGTDAGSQISDSTDVIANDDGTFTSKTTGLIFDADANVVGGMNESDKPPLPINFPGIVDNEDGTFTDPQTGVVYGAAEAFGFDPTKPFGPDAPPARTGGGFNSGGGAPSPSISGGAANPKQDKSVAAKKSILSDVREGNDRVLIYSDGTVQRLKNYYKPAAGTGAKNNPTNTVTRTVADLARAANAVSVLSSGRNLSGRPVNAPKNSGVATTATAITGRAVNTLANAAGGGANTVTPSTAAAANKKNLVLIGAALVGAYFIISST